MVKCVWAVSEKISLFTSTLIYFSDQLLFLDGETLFKNPVGEISRVENFLGIKNELGPKNFVRE